MARGAGGSSEVLPPPPPHMSTADILTAILVIGLAVIPTWLVLRWAGRAVARKRARLVEPSTYGDDGGRPALDRTLKPWKAGD